MEHSERLHILQQKVIDLYEAKDPNRADWADKIHFDELRPHYEMIKDFYSRSSIRDTSGQ